MQLISCSNCVFNPLQYGSLGLTLGYCSEFKCVLRQADSTTCGRLFRKDLPLASAEAANVNHRIYFDSERIQNTRTRLAMDGLPEFVEPDDSILQADAVGEVVTEYGALGTKIESIAQLRRIEGARAELGMLSLGRSYVRRCVSRDGAWTSGLHILWWTRMRLADEPSVSVSDFRLQNNATLDKQRELAIWSLVMLRLTYISDIGVHAGRHDKAIGELASFVDDAAEESSTSLRKLMRWVRRAGIQRFDKALSKERYVELAQTLHLDR